MKVYLERQHQGAVETLEIDYPQDDPKQRPMALDVLLHAQNSEAPDLAYRYGCRNGLCGVCTVNVNGRTKLACNTKLRDGDRVSAMAGLPVVRDFIVRREGVNRQLKQRLPQPPRQQVPSAEQQAAYANLNRCIECYACVDGCPMHAQNDLDGAPPDTGYRYGNPYTLLRVRQLQVNPDADSHMHQQALEAAVDLGLEACLSCKGCRCGVGIDLKKDVIQPLKQQYQTD